MNWRADSTAFRSDVQSSTRARCGHSRRGNSADRRLRVAPSWLSGYRDAEPPNLPCVKQYGDFRLPGGENQAQTVTHLRTKGET
jgi:hypothetical protein